MIRNNPLENSFQEALVSEDCQTPPVRLQTGRGTNLALSVNPTKK
jgi:hypothetical protein